MNTIDSVEKKTTPTSTNASTEISSPKSYNGDNNPIRFLLLYSLLKIVIFIMFRY